MGRKSSGSVQCKACDRLKHTSARAKATTDCTASIGRRISSVFQSKRRTIAGSRMFIKRKKVGEENNTGFYHTGWMQSLDVNNLAFYSMLPTIFVRFFKLQKPFC
jgi:hypothetical protein